MKGMVIIMKKSILALVVLLISLITTSTAYAGSLNAYESDVINAARGQFEYQGVLYKLDSSYVNELIGYLAEDSIDLTKDQRDAVLQSMNDYIETGVQEGYLVPVQGKTNQGNTASDTNSTSGNSTIDTNPSTDNSGNSGSENSSSDSKDTNSSSQEDAETGSSNNNNTKDSETATDNEADPASGEFMDGLLSKNTESTAQNTAAADNNTEITNTTVIKKTGFNFNTTIMIATSMGVLMLAGIIVTTKYKFFARSDE
ncbi:MAG: hypothetical protein PHF63_10010 [Herbinix sp.]|nr:hypothetical protein [Herbinix sp.]